MIHTNGLQADYIVYLKIFALSIVLILSSFHFISCRFVEQTKKVLV